MNVVNQKNEHLQFFFYFMKGVSMILHCSDTLEGEKPNAPNEN